MGCPGAGDHSDGLQLGIKKCDCERYVLGVVSPKTCSFQRVGSSGRSEVTVCVLEGAIDILTLPPTWLFLLPGLLEVSGLLHTIMLCLNTIQGAW